MKRTRTEAGKPLDPSLRPTPPPRVPALVRGGIALAALGIVACASDDEGEKNAGLNDGGERGDAASSSGGRAPMTPPMINGSGGLTGPMFNPGTGGGVIAPMVPPNPPPMIAPMPFPGAGGAAITPMPEPAAGGAPIAPMPPPMPAPAAGGAPIAPMPPPMPAPDAPDEPQR